jgi:hypothetical protein
MIQMSSRLVLTELAIKIDQFNNLYFKVRTIFHFGLLTQEFSLI